MDFYLAFPGKKGNNSIDRRVMSMEIAMRRFAESIKSLSHDLAWCPEALGQAVTNMRDYPRI